MTAKMNTRVVFLFVALITLTFTSVALAGDIPTLSLSMSANPTSVANGGTVQLTYDLCPDEGLIGTEAEWWIVAKSPTGVKHYLSGGVWYEGSARAFSLAAIAVSTKTFTSLTFNEAGTWTFYFLLDGDQDGSPATDGYSCSTTVTVTDNGGGGCGSCTEPTAGITVSNANPSLNGTVTLTLSMNGGSYVGHDAEWWLVAYSPGGAKYYYNGSTWTTTKIYYSRASITTFTGVTIVTPSLSWEGSWTFYFGVDGVLNGEIDDVWYASIHVTVGGGGGGGSGTLPQWRVKCTDYRLDLGQTVGLRLTLDAGDYTGTQVELWLVAVTPSGDKVYYNGSSWVSSVSPFATGALVDVDQTIASFALTEAGTYTFWFGADDSLNGAIDLPQHMDVDRTTAADLPTAYIKANGTSGSLVVSAGTTVNLTVALDPGSYAGYNADWWVVGVTPSAMTYTFNYDSQAWTHGYSTYMTGYIAEVNWTSVTSVTLTQTGTYHFYFGVDEPNGYVDMPAYQEVVVYVQ